MTILQRERGRRTATGRGLAALAGLAAAACLLGLLVAGGCTEVPTDPGPDNPLDPEGPQGGDPFHLQALRSGDQVLLRWDLLTGQPGVRGYAISRSVDPDSLVEIDRVEADAETYLDTSPAPGTVNYYRVRAVDAEGRTSAASLLTPESVWTLPRLEIEEGAETTPTRHVTVGLRTSFGDVVDLARSEDLAGAVTLPIAAGDTTNLLPFDLGPAGADGDTAHVWARVRLGQVAAPLAHDQVEVAFEPELALVGSPATLASRLVDLAVDAAGADSMRFALSLAGLAAAPWAPADSLVTGFELGPEPEPQTIYGAFLCDFGFAVTRQVAAVPDDLTGAAFVLDGDAEVTGSATVRVDSDARALWMRFGTGPDLRTVPWQAYADTITLSLDPTPGTKTVYGQFRNDWTVSPVVADRIVLAAGTEPLVAFTVPAAGAELAGGTPLLLAGTASAAAGGAPLDSVLVDWGEGYRRADGLASWSLVWPVPAVAADSVASLSARAFAGTGTGAAVVTVTIKP